MKQILWPLFVAVIVGGAINFVLGGGFERISIMRRRLGFIHAMYRRDSGYREEDKRSFSERIIIPMSSLLIQRIAMVLPLNSEERERLDKQLAMAGSQLKAKEYTAVTIIMVVFLAVFGYLFSAFVLSKSPLLGALLGAYAGYTVRRFSLTSRITKRKDAIENQLPNIIDLLSVSVTAGLAFEQALNYVTDRCEGEFVNELRLVQQQLLMGRARKEAMKGLAERCSVDEVTTFVASVLQAEEVGISMQSILNSQSASIRLAHKQKVEEIAGKLPVKILLPIVLFIFPVIFIVLLGPAVPGMLAALGGI